MAQTTIATENIEVQWRSEYFSEYVQDSRFFPYAGTSSDNVFTYVMDLETKAGQSISVPLVGRITAPAILDDAQLKGNETPLFNAGHAIPIHLRRQGVDVNKWQQQLSSIDVMKAAREELKKWSMSDLRDEQITSLMSPSLANTPYFSATEAEKDTWLTNNVDRILFGAARANTVAGDHSASLLNVDNTNDKLTKETLSVAKRMALQADPHIGPLRTNGNEEWFVVFASSYPFRDLQDSLATTNQSAWTRGMDNPLFSGGNLVWDGMIIVEIPQIPVIPGAGAGGIDVAATFLCGVQAIGTAWAQAPTFRTQVDDYEALKGVAVEEMRGSHKLFYNTPGGLTVQHGMVTIYTAAVADA